MFAHKFARGGLPWTAVVLLVLAGSPAMAQQQGWPLNPGFNGFSETPATTYYAPAPAFVPATVPGATAAVAPTEGQALSFYPSTAAEVYGRPERSRAVQINVAVPANAEILFGTFKTTQRGAQRTFVSPPLVPGSNYSYDVTAKWREGGREIVRTRHLTVHAGDVLNVSF